MGPSSPHSPAPMPPSTRPLGPIPSCPRKHRASLDLLLTDTIVSSLYAASSHQQVNTNRFLPPRNETPLLSRLHIGLRFPLCPSAPFLGNYSKEVSLPCLHLSQRRSRAHVLHGAHTDGFRPASGSPDHCPVPPSGPSPLGLQHGGRSAAPPRES